MDVYVLNKAFELIAVVDDYESLIWTDRHDSCGDFQIVFGMNIGLLSIFQEDYYIQIKKSEHTMIIEDIAISTNVENGAKLTITGRSLESILDRRIIWSAPTFSNNFGLQNGLKILLSQCFGNDAITNRRIENFVFVETSDAKIVAAIIPDHAYEGDNIYDVVCKLCAANKVGFKIILSETSKGGKRDFEFRFSLYTGTDRSYGQNDNPYVIFSPKFDNLLDSNYYQSKADYKNVAWVLGESERKKTNGTYTTILHSRTVGTATGLDRREIFVDARDSSLLEKDDDGNTVFPNEYNNLLDAKGRQNLAEHETVKAFEGSVDTTGMFEYGKDYFVGDIVQIANEYGHEGKAYISEVVISCSREGQSIYPTFQTIN